LSLDQCLQDIADAGTSLNYNILVGLSDLAPAELGLFAKAWWKIEVSRRRHVIDCMVVNAEENADLDFCSVIKVCLKDSDDQVRQRAIEGLWEVEDRSLILSLMEVLKSDGAGEVRASAAMALGKFASLAQDGKVLSKDGDEVRESLLQALEDENEWLGVRRRALEAAAPFNMAQVHRHIQWAYDSDDQDMKCSSLYAMGKTGNSVWLPVLYRELQSSLPPMRYEAATACGEIDEEESAPHLVSLIQDDDLQVQLAAIGALGKIGGSLAKRALRHCLKMGDQVLEDAARESLEAIQATEDPLSFRFDF
jgi:hypothetical protein